MPKLLKCLLSTCLFLLHQHASAVDPIIYRYEKSLLRHGYIDFAAIFSKNYSEIRWDQDGDGSTDYWFIQSGSLEIQEYFEKSLLKSVVIQKRTNDGHIKLIYSNSSSSTLRLVESQYYPHQIHQNLKENDTQFGDDFYAILDSNSAHKKSIPEDNLCKRNIESFFKGDAQVWKEIQAATASWSQKEKLKAMISDECKNKLSLIQQEQLFKSLSAIYEVNLAGTVEDNRILTCFANSEGTRNYVPQLVTKIVQGPLQEPKLKISCADSSAEGCGKASYDDKSCRIDLPISNPPCQKDMGPVFSKNILHETLHSIDPTLGESLIQAITDTCLPSMSKKNEISKLGDKEVSNGKPNLAENLNSESLKNMKDLKIEQAKEVKELNLNKTMRRFPASGTTKINSESAPKVVTNIPTEVAAENLSPGKPIGASSGMTSLNSDFKPVDASSSAKPSLSESYSRSQDRTSPVIKRVNRLIGGAIVPSAIAETRSSGSRKIASEAVGSASSSSAKSSSSRNAKTTSVSRSPKKQVQSTWVNRSANHDGTTSPAPSFAVDSPNSSLGMAQSTGQPDLSHHPEVSTPSKTNDQGQQASIIRNPASSASPDLNLKGARQGSSAAAQNPSASASQRAYFEKQLLQKRSSGLWGFVKKNQEQLRNLGIHILDSENRIWGFQDPENASSRFREQNSRLIRED